MNEREKLEKGEMYNAYNDRTFFQDMITCQDLCLELNQLKLSMMEERYKIIKKILGKTTDSFLILSPFLCNYGYNIEIGDRFFANSNCVILDAAKVTFGDNVFIAPNCGFYTSGHAFDAEQRNKGLAYAHPITVGNNVWICANSIVLPGITIGDNSIIGAGSIVTKDIPANAFAAGNPCKVIRELVQ